MDFRQGWDNGLLFFGRPKTASAACGGDVLDANWYTPLTRNDPGDSFEIDLTPDLIPPALAGGAFGTLPGNESRGRWKSDPGGTQLAPGIDRSPAAPLPRLSYRQKTMVHASA
jgi:hypothetical protein